MLRHVLDLPFNGRPFHNDEGKRTNDDDTTVFFAAYSSLTLPVPSDNQSLTAWT